ncbi:MAG: cytochrome c3 family protein [Candidatus Eisenbacteria bacterium]
MKARLILGALIAYFLVWGGLIVLLTHLRGARAEGPAQPIAFSHPLHTEQVGLDCRHCHTTVDRAAFPGIPAVAVCMDCHRAAAVDRPEVQKLIRHWTAQEPIAWTQVHRLPAHVHFTHKRHTAAEVACVSCHGDVRFQDRIRQVRSLKMGWCVNCHRDRAAGTDCWTCHR